MRRVMLLRPKVGLVFAIASVAGCMSSNNKVVLDSHPGFSCSPPNTIKYAGWGESGLSKSCVNSDGQVDGSFWTADYGRFYVRGYLKNGKESETWEFVDTKGVVTKKVMGN
jgi:hypothetical protein